MKSWNVTCPECTYAARGLTLETARKLVTEHHRESKGEVQTAARKLGMDPRSTEGKDYVRERCHYPDLRANDSRSFAALLSETPTVGSHA